MKEKDSFFKTVCHLAVPAALQSMLQSSFSMVDQIMIGQLGEIQLGAVSVAAVGLAGKFASIYAVVIAAIGAVAGIMISQYLGQKNSAEVRRSFFGTSCSGWALPHSLPRSARCFRDRSCASIQRMTGSNRQRRSI